MSENSKIEWTDSTWNPVLGCCKVSPGCKGCYATRVVHRLAGNPNPKIRAANEGLTVIQGGSPNWTGKVRLIEDRLAQPARKRKPTRYFVNSLSDLFHENLSIDDIEKVWRSMCAALYRGHIFQILTKQAKRMATVVPVVMNRIYGFNWRMPDGIWLGVSAENQEMANERIPWLLRTPAAVRFVSYEPALGPVDFTRIEYEPGGSGGTVFIDALWGTFSSVGGGGELGKLSWLIAGGESGKGARPAHPDWFRRSRDQCAAAGVPYFFKQWGSWLPIATQRLNAKLGSTLLISPDGHTGPATWSDVMATAGNVWAVQKVGKRKAGRLLDGVEHSEFPGIPNQPASS